MVNEVDVESSLWSWYQRDYNEYYQTLLSQLMLPQATKEYSPVLMRAVFHTDGAEAFSNDR